MTAPGHELEHRRARELLIRAARHRVDGSSDDELLELLAEHRWAVARLTSTTLPLATRSLLNSAVLKTYGLLYTNPRRLTPPLGLALRRLGQGLVISTGVFCGSALLAFTAVAADPVLASSIVSRDMLQQIDPNHWGSRGALAGDVGMTLFYWSNNLRASFFALGLGVLGGAPAMLVIAINGALIGAVGAAAMMRGAGERFLGWIAPHGVPEIAGVILCGAIGWELGRSWMEPGWRRRRAALAEAGRVLTPMVLAAALLIICAAPLEGFVAPLDLPWWLDLAFVVGWLLVLGAGARFILRGSLASSPLAAFPPPRGRVEPTDPTPCDPA